SNAVLPARRRCKDWDNRNRSRAAERPKPRVQASCRLQFIDSSNSQIAFKVHPPCTFCFQLVSDNRLSSRRDECVDEKLLAVGRDVVGVILAVRKAQLE